MRNHMTQRTAAMLVFVTIVAAPAIFAGEVFAAGTEESAVKTRPAAADRRAATTRAARTPAPPAARAAADADAAYRCRPEEDIACTVVRETAQGILIVTFRPAAGAAGSASAAGGATERKTWAVVSGIPAGRSAQGGGTVYVVPSLPQNLAVASGHSPAVTVAMPNGAPILE